MKILKKKLLAVITLVLMLSIAVSLFASIQTVKAAASYPTFAYVATNANPVGVGQSAFVTVWLSYYPPRGILGSNPFVLWQFTLTITDPSGNIQTKELTSDPIGGVTLTLTPDKVGTWTLQAKFKGAGPVLGANNDTYRPSTSNLFSLIVQEEPVLAWPGAALPTSYWERPIDAQNREWSSISGNWVGMPWVTSPGSSSSYSSMGKFNPYTLGPNTPHIVWRDSAISGGVVGGQYGSVGYYAGDSYDLKHYPLIIMNGVIYKNNQVSSRSITNIGFYATDLRTGKELWRTTNGSILFGQLLDYESLNQHGVIPFLWSSTLDVYDANTGMWLWNFGNVTTGQLIQDEKGNILSYVLNQAQHTLTLWNSTVATLLGKPGGPAANEGQEYWRPTKFATNNWKAGIMYNVTIPPVQGNPSIKNIDVVDGVILAQANLPSNDTYPEGVTVHAAYSTKDGHEMWVKYRTGEDSLTGQQAGFGYTVGPGAYYVQKQETEVIFAYDILTGNKMWVSDPKPNPWGSYYTTIGDDSLLVAYDKLYATSYDGTLRCFDAKTGENFWNTYIGSSGFETPYGTWPLWGSLLAADGKIYAGTNEHSINQPPYRGERLYAFDAETGDILWKVYGIHMDPAIADGYLVTFNTYDNQNYVFGKSQTAVTVSASPKVSASGADVLIEGSVTDQAPGQTCLGIPAAGTPAISDESQGPWMEYLYMQKPMPTNATGVEVKLETIDPNGNFYEISTVTSDINGKFSLMWEPPVPGKYTIIATFAGSESYWMSYEQTAIGVSEPLPSAPEVETPVSNTDAYVMYGVVAIIVAIAIVGAVIILVVKKRP